MIQQGTDGISRGDFSSGIMVGTPMLSFIPLHLSALDRPPNLLSWLQSWIPLCDIEPLNPEDWFELGHGLCGGHKNSAGIWEPCEVREKWFLWTPPPAAAGAALDELLLSRQKQTHLNHVFICPSLLTSMWHKCLHKVADLVLELLVGCIPSWAPACHTNLLSLD
jgi:hypothetical protein